MKNTNGMTGAQPQEEKLKIYTLGRFQVQYGGQTLFAGHGRSQKLAEFFMYLITQRGKPATPEAILEALWPEQEYVNPKNALKNLVYRLKQNLGGMGVPHAKSFISHSYGCYGWSRDAPYWLDADAFETLCDEASVLARTDPLAAIGTYREALSLYRGYYLPECHYCSWVLPRRHHYRRLFVKSLTELLALQKEHRLFSQMVEDGEKALEVEDVDENVHLHYIDALLEEGKTAQARAHYEYITSLFYHELGASPSRPMQLAYRKIKAQAEKTELEFIELQELMKERDEAPGSLLCDPEYFRFLCRVEKRRAERADLPAYLGLLTLSGAGFRPLSPEALQASMGRLQQVLQKGLRKGDVISPWNESQFTLLLPGTSQEQAEKVLERLREAFHKANPDKDRVLRGSVHPVLPFD